VHFIPSPGGEIANASAATDENGLASVNWRLPSAEGVALLSVSANTHLVNVLGAGDSFGLDEFPSAFASGLKTPLGAGPDPISAKGALLVSAAAALRYYQVRGDLPAPQGLADPSTLNAFLNSVCSTDTTGVQVCDGFLQPAGTADSIVNLWRLQGFVGNALDVRTISADERVVRDAIAGGAPVILALTMTQNGAPAGAHFVVAMGVDANGNLVIMDPDPAYAQTNLFSYGNGFRAASGATIAGTLTGAAVLLAKAPASPGFLVTASAQTALESRLGPCGSALVFPEGSGSFALHYCDGTAPAYQLSAQLSNGLPVDTLRGLLIDLANAPGRAEFSGSGSASFGIDHASGQWTVSALTAQFRAEDVVNSASLTTQVAPGGLASILGSGLASPGSQTVVAVNGEYAPLLQATPFRLDFQMPADAQPGPAVVDVVTDAAGSAEQTVTLSSLAPAIQLLGAAGTRRGHVTNADGSANSRYQPASRGRTLNVFGTGFGPPALPRGFATPVQAYLGGVEVPVTAVAPASSSPGIFQVTLAVPASLAPGLSLELVLKQGDALSNAVDVAVQ